MNRLTSIGDVPIDGHGLDDAQVRLILRRRVEVAAEETVAREAGTTVIVCLIGGERFALPLAVIAEVLPTRPPVKVPTAPASLAGLILRRGLVYNLMDPSSSLGVPSRRSAHTLLLRGSTPRIALRVDEAVEMGEIAGGDVDGGGLTGTRFFADGSRVELIAIQRLDASLGHSQGIEPT